MSDYTHEILQVIDERVFDKDIRRGEHWERLCAIALAVFGAAMMLVVVLTLIH